MTGAASLATPPCHTSARDHVDFCEAGTLFVHYCTHPRYVFIDDKLVSFSCFEVLSGQHITFRL